MRLPLALGAPTILHTSGWLLALGVPNLLVPLPVAMGSNAWARPRRPSHTHLRHRHAWPAYPGGAPAVRHHLRLRMMHHKTSPPDTPP